MCRWWCALTQRDSCAHKASSTAGKLRPLVIEFDEEHKYPVDKVLDIRRAACQRVGGVGDRYTCRINGQVTYLWMEKGVWFVEAKE